MLAANGFHVLVTQGATPTPVISYAVMAQRAAGGTDERFDSKNVAPKKDRSWTKAVLTESV